MFRTFGIAALLCISLAAAAQWQMQDSHTNAGLRGIHAVDGKIAWASGTNGTVLHTEDGGANWQKCTVPPDADKLDFRGVWAWDAKHAMVMSAGPGEASRIYETRDGCATWTEIARNKDKDGFWDAMVFQAGPAPTAGVLVGDPIRGRFDTRVWSADKGWSTPDESCAANNPGEAAFAASNSSVVVLDARRYAFGTGGKGGPRVLIPPLQFSSQEMNLCLAAAVPLASGGESTGVFSLGFRDLKHGLAVGGDYKKPAESAGTAAWTSDGGLHWTAASKPPHGYRSSVAWSAELKAWIAAGTNGSDISHDDGKTWQPLDDGNWNALSLPFVVGPGGRIARLTQLKK